MMGRLFSKWGAIAAIAILVAVQAAAVNYLGRNNYLPEGSEHWCNGPLEVNPFFCAISTAGVMLLYGVSAGLPPDGV